jgi:DICT domain-containing protein
MEDLKNRLDKVTADAADCDLIANLATDAEKRKMFRELADQYRRMADALRAEIERRRST